MKGSKIFLAWLMTVLVAGLLIPSAIIAFPTLFKTTSYGVSKIIEEYFKTAFIMILNVSLLSLPTIITLLIRNVIISKKYTLKQTLRKINKTHLLVPLITIMIPVICVLSMEFNDSRLQKRNFNPNPYFSPLFPLLCTFFCYFICAIPIWYFIFKKEIKEIRNSKNL